MSTPHKKIKNKYTLRSTKKSKKKKGSRKKINK